MSELQQEEGLAGSAADWPKALFYVALLFSIYQIVMAAFHPVSSQVLRAGHVGFLLMVVFLYFPAAGKGRPWQPLAWVLALAGMGTAFYQWYFEADLIQRSGDLTTLDFAVGVLLIALVFEAARRVMGIALPIICAIFLAYGLLGQYLPGDLAHRGYGIDQMVNQLATAGLQQIKVFDRSLGCLHGGFRAVDAFAVQLGDAHPDRVVHTAGAAREDVDEGRGSDCGGAGREGRCGSEQAEAFGQSHGVSPFRCYWSCRTDDRRSATALGLHAKTRKGRRRRTCFHGGEQSAVRLFLSLVVASGSSDIARAVPQALKALFQPIRAGNKPPLARSRS